MFGYLIKNKSSYEGEFLDGLRNGYGNLQRILKIQGENKEYKYSGFWKFGRRFGFGKVFLNSLLYYEGIFSNENGFLGTLYPNNEANFGINKLVIFLLKR